MAKILTYSQRHELACPQLRQARSGAVLIYNHIPKCGGLSLTHMLKHCYASSCDVHQNIFDPRATPLDRQFYHGHGVSGIERYLAEDAIYFYITILRHPWSLAQSLVRFFTWLTPLDPWYKQKPEDLLLLQQPNILTQYLGHGDLDLALENVLHNYVFFGLQEFFPASIQLLGQSLPEILQAPPIAKNVSTKEPWHIDTAIKEAFWERNAKDIALYTAAKEEFLRRAGLDGAKESAKKAVTPSLPSSNTTGDNLTTIYSLKESIALGEDLPAMDKIGARFENWQHILVHSLQSESEEEKYYAWLQARIPARASCLYFAYACAKKSSSAKLQADVPLLAQKLFALCMLRDPHNTCRLLVECRFDVLALALERSIFCAHKKDAIIALFAATAYGWLKNMQEIKAWQEIARELLTIWEKQLSPLALKMLQSHAEKICSIQ